MDPSTKNLPRFRRPPDISKEKRVDVVLKRVAQISQIVLVMAAIGGYFYSVAPIHQKQLLDERIAEQRLELAQQHAESDKLALQLRTQSEALRDSQRQLSDVQYSAFRSRVLLKLRNAIVNACDKQVTDQLINKADKGIATKLARDRDDFKRCILAARAETQDLSGLNSIDNALLDDWSDCSTESAITMSLALDERIAKPAAQLVEKTAKEFAAKYRRNLAAMQKDVRLQDPTQRAKLETEFAKNNPDPMPLFFWSMFARPQMQSTVHQNMASEIVFNVLDSKKCDRSPPSFGIGPGQAVGSKQ
jgi:hypothetical protein